MAVRPPLKWYGGKRYLADWIVGHFPEHRIYLEPFGGGASVLLNKQPVEVETYNDIDLRLTRFFRVLRDQGDEFIRRASLTPYSQVEFETARDSRDSEGYPIGSGEVDRALLDFIRWRQSFAGKGQSWSYTTTRARGGMAGDVNAWWTAIEALPQVIDRIRRVQFICQSAFDAIPRFDHEEGLIYCDPPYLHGTRAQGSTNVYHAEMTDAEHRQLAELLTSCKSAIVLSGYDSPMYHELYRKWQKVTRDIANHAAGGGSKSRETECLWIKPAKTNGKARPASRAATIPMRRESDVVEACAE
ncbi:MAG: DNA adenine methylase [Planctomycetaceae bacterium]|nr:DNA adenine methylase [Planctomycetaceae bacterium]